jgi:hypothetical protein
MVELKGSSRPRLTLASIVGDLICRAARRRCCRRGRRQIVPGITMTREDLAELRSVTFDSNGDPVAVSAVSPDTNIRTVVNHS